MVSEAPSKTPHIVRSWVAPCHFGVLLPWQAPRLRNGVLADGKVVGRIFKANASPVGASWMWTLAFGHHEDRTPTHGYAATREAAMAAFAKSWRRE
jgi:hypothetical protein